MRNTTPHWTADRGVVPHDAHRRIHRRYECRDRGLLVEFYYFDTVINRYLVDAAIYDAEHIDITSMTPPVAVSRGSNMLDIFTYAMNALAVRCDRLQLESDGRDLVRKTGESGYG